MRNEEQLQPVKSAIEIVGFLKACATHKNLIKGARLHAYVQERTFLQKNPYVASSLINMYAKCGALAKAQQVLKNLPVLDVVSWNALIAGYAQQGQGEEALKCFETMQREGHSPDEVTFISALKACGSIRAAAKGEHIHDKVVSLGVLEKNVTLGNTMVDMYARCGALPKALQVLEGLPARNVVTWNALIAACAQQGKGEEALKFFDSLQCEGHSPDAVTCICALRACGLIGAAGKAEQIHEKFVSSGMLEKNVELGCILVSAYAKCGALAKAQQVLEGLPSRDVVTWSILIAGYAQQGQGDQALECLDNMQCEGHSPDAITFTYALKACGSIAAAAKGKQIHDKIVSLGMLEKNILLGSALVDMYAKCGALEQAQQVLEGLPVRNVVTWNALIAGYADQGKGEEALKCFESMQREGHAPDAITATCSLKACGSIGSVFKGEQIRKKVVILAMLEKNIELGSTLVDMYAKCGALAKAQEVLQRLPVRNVVTWNALIAGYVQEGQAEEALKCFYSMQLEGHSPDAVTFMCALKACGIIGADTKVEQIHKTVVSLGMLEKNVELGCTLVDAYAKCATLVRALRVFKELPQLSMVTWNALIGGFAQQGLITETLICFEKMLSEGIKPDSITLVCVLNACSHSGLLHQAEMLFSTMSIRYGFAPNVEHYSCMVDLFGRARKFNKALEMIEKMPSADYLPMWAALLGACRKWGEVNVGRLAFDCAFHLDKSNVAVYVCMADIYMAAGMQENADKIEVLRMANTI